MLLRLASESEEADPALHAALSRAQSCSWKSVKSPGATVLVSAQVRGPAPRGRGHRQKDTVVQSFP